MGMGEAMVVKTAVREGVAAVIRQHTRLVIGMALGPERRTMPMAPPGAVAMAQIVSVKMKTEKLDSVEDDGDEGIDGILVVGVHLGGVAVCNDHAAGHGAVAEQRGEAGECATFHLEVADAKVAVAE